MKQKSKKLLLTGGHAGTTAIALVQSIKKIDPTIDLYWIGAKRATEGTKHPTIESKYLPDLGVKVSLITSGKLQTKFSFWTIPSLLKIPFGFISAFIEILKIRPDVIISFGGYTAFPVVICGWVMGNPVIIHDQTVVAGRANQLSSFFATKIAVARESSIRYFPPKKVEVTGNPVMDQIYKVSIKKTLAKIPTIFVTGGSRGSLRLNEVFYEILPSLLTSYRVIHITGERGIAQAQEVYSKLPLTLQKNYTILSQVSPFNISTYWEKADIVVARSGANTVSEVLATVRPTIFVPLPYTYLDEQTKNANFAKKYGIAKVILEHELTSKNLLKTIGIVRASWGEMVIQGTKIRKIDKNASELLGKLVIDEVWKKEKLEQ